MIEQLKNHIITIVIILLINTVAIAQNTDSTNAQLLEVKTGYGVLIKHHANMDYYMHHIPSLRIKYVIKSRGLENWEQLYNYPEYGIGYFAGDLGDKDVLGYVHALFSFINLSLYRGNKLNLNFQLAGGLSYITKCFDPNTNYTNLIIGSHFNVYFNMNLNLNYKLSKNTDITLGLGGSHYSNGTVVQPNLGINSTDVNIGLRYYLNPQEQGFVKSKTYSKKSFYTSYFVLAMGAKSIPPAGGKIYSTPTFSINLAKENQKRRYGFGLDFFYDSSISEKYFDNQETEFLDILRTGIFVSHEFIISKISLVSQVGVYTFTRTTALWPVYARVGVRYKITENLQTNITLKSHLGVADFIEFGIGYKFNYNSK